MSLQKNTELDEARCLSTLQHLQDNAERAQRLDKVGVLWVQGLDQELDCMALEFVSLAGELFQIMPPCLCSINPCLFRVLLPPPPIPIVQPLEPHK